MMPITGTQENHTLQPSLESRHKETVGWLSSIKLWQKELSFFQNILDGTAHYFTSSEEKKKVSRFQNLFMYYHAEVLLELRTKLRNHENHLGDIFRKENVADNPYYMEHNSLMSELQQFSRTFADLKNEFFKFIERLK